MNIHQNARLTPQGRLLLVERITEAGWSVGQVAQAAGISVRQSYRWLARYRAEGPAGLADRSSAPHRCQRRIPSDRVGNIERLRRLRMSGPQIARQLGMPVSTVGGVLRRAEQPICDNAFYRHHAANGNFKGPRRTRQSIPMRCP
jgi:transposase-like protein